MNGYEFWVVLKEKTEKISRKHTSEKEAVEEAKRLAVLCPGERFYILQANKMAVVETPVEVIRLEEVEVPF